MAKELSAAETAAKSMTPGKTSRRAFMDYRIDGGSMQYAEWLKTGGTGKAVADPDKKPGLGN